MTTSTKVLWRVQYRKSRAHKWKNAGLYETRANARDSCSELRDGWAENAASCSGYGFGNTRVVRYVKAEK